jgi:hypothetical protein
MRRRLFILLLLAACGSDQVFEHDLEPIQLSRAPIEPGGAMMGGLLAAVSTVAGIEPLLVDTAFPIDSLGRAGCAAGAVAGWTYTGDMNLRGNWQSATPLRASFRNVGLFDTCPGFVGDTTTQPAGVLGGPLLANFSVGLVLPRDAAQPAIMTLWPSYPGTDDQLAVDGLAALHFEPRGSASVGQVGGEASLTLPNSRIVLAACAAPRAFATTEAQETCAHGEVALKASGQDVMLAVGTGEGPLILSDMAWGRVAAQLGVAADAGTAGELYTPFATTATPALYVDLPRLALLQGTTDSNWLGACTELARARRIEWVLANQDNGACFQPCDASGSSAASTRPYVELGGSLRVAVVSETSEVIRSLNGDVPVRTQIDGIVGAGTLAGTRLRLDYLSQPTGRVLAACEAGATRETCWTAPSCPPLSGNGQTLMCFAQTVSVSAQVCK